VAPDDPAERLDRLTDLATPFAVRTAVTLRVPDRIAAGAGRLDELAAACGADRDALGRLLRFLAHRGVFVEVAPDEFELTEVGKLLCHGEAGGYGAHLDLEGLGARMDLAFAGLPHAVRTGEPGYAAVHGRDLWADLDAVPRFRAYFDELMRGLQRVTAPEVAALYPWRDVGHVTDVGGGSGGLLAELLERHPHLRGTLVDRAEPVATATAMLAERGLAGRVDVVPGDFFDPLPPGADVYVVSRVLTDWGDAQATAILRRCAEAAGSTGRVLVVEVLPDGPHSSYDLTMLVVVGGRERGLDEHIALAAEAGLRHVHTYRGGAGLALLEFAGCG
jgi:2,7-dihydroxy-5-methyl-1-naphthoate 7-O-methyltransferase